MLSGCTANKNTDNPPTESPTLAATFTPTIILTATATAIPTEIPTPTVSPTPDPNRYTEQSATPKFSYVPPEKWTNRNMIGDIDGWVGPNEMRISFQTLGNGSDAKMASKEWIDRLLQGSQYEILSEGPFITYAGVDAYKTELKVNFTQSPDKVYHFVEYFFLYKGSIVEAGFSRNFSDNSDYDAIIDQMMTTFQFEAK